MTTAARVSAVETALAALQERVARLEAPPEAKPAAARDGVRCAICGTSIAPTMLARGEVFGITTRTTPDGAQVVLCSPTCAGAHERTAT